MNHRLEIIQSYLLTKLLKNHHTMKVTMTKAKKLVTAQIFAPDPRMCEKTNLLLYKFSLQN